MNIMALLEVLDEELSTASSLPLTSRKLVDADTCKDILSDLRVHLPDDIKEAEAIVNERNRLIAEAESEAENILANADQDAADRVATHEITRQARQEAKTILTDAQRKARDIHYDAIQYADDILAELEHHVADMLAEIRKNRQELRSREQR